MKTSPRILAAILTIATFAAASTLRAEPPPPLTDGMVRNFLLAWFQSTNDHRPVEELLPMLDDRVEMFYPDKPEPFTGKEAFKTWYAAALEKYFDETHHLEAFEAKVDGDSAEVDLIVRWERRSWQPGAALSRYDASLSYQEIVVARDPESGRLTIRKKVVKKFDPTGPIFGH